jgi:hypothetical protein
VTTVEETLANNELNFIGHRTTKHHMGQGRQYQANNYIYIFLETDNECIQESDRIFYEHGNHISSYELSVADIISYLILWPHVSDTALVNIHSPSEGYAQSNWSHLEL